MLQPATPRLLTRLADTGVEVLLQTNGSLDVTGVDPRVARCIDVKCPGSGEAGAMYWPNLDSLRAGDEVRFVLANRADYDYARGVVLARGATNGDSIYLSGVKDRDGPHSSSRNRGGHHLSSPLRHRAGRLPVIAASAEKYLLSRFLYADKYILSPFL